MPPPTCRTATRAPRSCSAASFACNLALLRALVRLRWFGIQTWIGRGGFFIRSARSPGTAGPPRPPRSAATRGPSGCRSRSSGCGDGDPRTTRCAASRTGRAGRAGGLALLAYMVTKRTASARCSPSGKWAGQPVLAGFFPSLIALPAHAVAEHAGFHQVRPSGAPAGHRPLRPADHDDVLLAVVLITAASQKPRRSDASPEVRAVQHPWWPPCSGQRGGEHGLARPTTSPTRPAPAGQLPHGAGASSGHRHPAVAAAGPNPHIYIYAWLGFYGGLLGAVGAAGAIADYWLIRRTELRLAQLGPHGAYWYTGLAAAGVRGRRAAGRRRGVLVPRHLPVPGQRGSRR